MTVVINGTTGIDTLIDGAVSTTAKLANSIVTPAKLTQPLTLGTAQNTTSGTSIDFTGIPSWAKRITVMFNGVSTNGGSGWLVQLGNSGGVEITGYYSLGTALASSSTVSQVTLTTGFYMNTSGGAGAVLHGTMTLSIVSGSTWVGTHTAQHNGWGLVGSGIKTLSATLDRIRLTTTNGTDTFDAGSVNILFE